MVLRLVAAHAVAAALRGLRGLGALPYPGARTYTHARADAVAYADTRAYTITHAHAMAYAAEASRLAGGRPIPLATL